jgi:aryl-alcohol dehydrogenase-like predicted oxidoreductase
MQANSKLGIGSVQFGLDYGIANNKGQTDSNEVSRILKYALKNNINIIDTAAVYGSSESVLGQNDLSEFKIISKFITHNKETVSSQFYSSISKLKVENLYGYLAHRPLTLLQNRECWDELLELKANRRVEKIGFSLNSPAELEEILENNIYPDLIQVPYNYFDNRFKSLLIELKEKGCEIHSRSTFLQGLFFTNPSELPEYFDEVKCHLIQLQQTVKDLPKALLNFVMQQPFIDKVIIGVETLSQLKENFENSENATVLTSCLESISDKILMPSNWPLNEK